MFSVIFSRDKIYPIPFNLDLAMHHVPAVASHGARDYSANMRDTARATDSTRTAFRSWHPTRGLRSVCSSAAGTQPSQLKHPRSIYSLTQETALVRFNCLLAVHTPSLPFVRLSFQVN